MTMLKDNVVKTCITALAGGANSASTPTLDGNVCVIATCATLNDSVRLPAGMRAGTIVRARNNGAASANVFPPAGGAINGGSADAAVALAAAKAADYVCTSNDGKTWFSLAGA